MSASEETEREAGELQLFEAVCDMSLLAEREREAGEFQLFKAVRALKVSRRCCHMT